MQKILKLAEVNLYLMVLFALHHPSHLDHYQKDAHQ